MKKKFLAFLTIAALGILVMTMTLPISLGASRSGKQDSCSDTDEGNVITVFGTVSGYYNKLPYSYSDYCVDSGSINEYYCVGTHQQSQQQSCGTDGYVGNNYCKSGDVYRNYTDYYCSETVGLPSDNGTFVSCDYCTPSWILNSTWSSCTTNGAQYKNSYDLNNCNESEGAPTDQVQPCDYSNGLLADGQPCNYSSDCSSNNCALDYDSSGKWCAPLGNCTHGVIVTYASGSTTCYNSNKETCNNGNWTSESCPYGCSSDNCNSAPTSQYISDGRGGGGGGFGNPRGGTTTLPPATTTTTLPPATTTTIPPENTTAITTLPSPLSVTGFIAYVTGNTSYQLLLVVVIIAVLLIIAMRKRFEPKHKPKHKPKRK